MNVLITGGHGFVGKETQEYFLSQGIGGYNYDLMDGNDIRDFSQLDAYVKARKPDRILHLAAIARFAEADLNPKLAFETNAIGTGNVALVAKKYHIPLVYASTGSVYMPIDGEPPITEHFKACGNSVYGCSKLVGEEYVKEGNPWIILRYAHLYGKEKRYHGLIGGFISRIEKGQSPELYGGKQSNDFTYIKDIARANYLAITASWDKWNQVYNIGTGEELSAERAGEIICRLTGYTGTIDVKQPRTVDARRFVFDTTKAERMLGFKAEYLFEQGLADMLK